MALLSLASRPLKTEILPAGSGVPNPIHTLTCGFHHEHIWILIGSYMGWSRSVCACLKETEMDGR